MVQIQPRTALFAGLLLLVGTNLAAQDAGRKGLTEEEAKQKAELRRAERQASAQPVSLVAPYFAISEDEQASLILISTVAQTLDFEIFAKTIAGDEQSLGIYYVERQRHLALALDQLVPSDQPEFQQGSLSIHLLGDSNALQAWLVLDRLGQVTEIPLQMTVAVQSTEFSSYWQPPAPTGGTAVFYFTNVSSRPVSYWIQNGRGDPLTPAQREKIRLGARHRITPKGRSGVFKIRHDGDPGSLIGVGFIEGDGMLQALPLLSPADLLRSSAYQVIEIPHLETASIALFNPQEHPQRVTLSLLEATSGRILSTRDVRLKPDEIDSYEIRRFFPVARNDSGIFRLSLEGTQPFLVSGHYALPSGSLVDLVFSPVEAAHSNGSYPLLPLADYEIYTTLVNLDGESVTIGAQVSWPGGDYAIGPLEIPGNGSYRLEVSQLVVENKADLLGRQLDPEYEQAFLRWTT